MDKQYLVTSTIGIDDFQKDIDGLIKPEFVFSAEEVIEILIERCERSGEDCTQTLEYLITDEEKAVANKALTFKFDVKENNKTLSISYIGYFE